MPMESGPSVLCVGGASIDTKFRLKDSLRAGTSNPSLATETIGGVAANVARNLAYLGNRVSLFAAVGADADAARIRTALERAGVATTYLTTIARASTARYAAILSPEGDLELGAAAMDINDALNLRHLEAIRLGEFDCIFADCNAPAHILDALRTRRFGGTYRFAIDAVSERKVLNLREKFDGIDVVFLNDGEARAYFAAQGDASPQQLTRRLIEEGARAAVVTRGWDGAYVASQDGSAHVRAVPVERVDVTGAGDAFVAGTIHAMLDGKRLDEAARTGAVCAALTIESNQSVRDDLSIRLVRERAQETV